MKRVSPQPGRLINVTPFPNNLLDDYLPRLSDTAWRVLCVVVRSTNGWIDPKTGGRKQADWLSQTQLIARTGRASAAISRAVDTLTQRGIIVVSNSTGQRLETPAERRRAKRLYFAIHPGLLAGHTTSSVKYSQSELPKANTTKQIDNKNNNKEAHLPKKRPFQPCHLDGWHKASRINPTR
jgi:biotin operon repressor